MVTKRPYIDIGLAILKRTSDGSVQLISNREYAFEREVEVELTLEPGSYIVLPRTTGCTLSTDFASKPLQAIELLMVNKQSQTTSLHPDLISTINDIFRKFDMLLTRELTYAEFKAFYDCINKQITPLEFEKSILNVFNGTAKGIS